MGVNTYLVGVPLEKGVCKKLSRGPDGGNRYCGTGPAFANSGHVDCEPQCGQPNYFGGWSIVADDASTKKQINVGSSSGNSKTVNVESDLHCPAVVNRKNWDNVDQHADTFSVTYAQAAQSRVTVRRTDSSSGWGMQLKFSCYKTNKKQVTVGSSGSTIKQVTVPKGLSCPSIVNRNNWDGGQTYGDTYGLRIIAHLPKFVHPHPIHDPRPPTLFANSGPPPTRQRIRFARSPHKQDKLFANATT